MSPAKKRNSQKPSISKIESEDQDPILADPEQVWDLKRIMPTQGGTRSPDFLERIVGPVDELYVKETYGGGTFKMIARDEQGKYSKSFTFSIGGPARFPKDENHNEPDDRSLDDIMDDLRGRFPEADVPEDLKRDLEEIKKSVSGSDDLRDFDRLIKKVIYAATLTPILSKIGQGGGNSSGIQDQLGLLEAAMGLITTGIKVGQGQPIVEKNSETNLMDVVNQNLPGILSILSSEKKRTGPVSPAPVPYRGTDQVPSRTDANPPVQEGEMAFQQRLYQSIEALIKALDSEADMADQEIADFVKQYLTDQDLQDIGQNLTYDNLFQVCKGNADAQLTLRENKDKVESVLKLIRSRDQSPQ